MTSDPRWLTWVRQLQTIADAGLTYARDVYDRERYAQLRAVAAEILANHAAIDPAEALAILAAERGYATPKVDVRAVVFRDGRMLMVREQDDRRWTCPGGWADIGSTPGEMAAREVLEETGLVVRPTRLLAVYDKRRHEHPPQLWYVYKIFIQCELVGGVERPNHEILEVGWFPRDALPELSIDRLTRRQARRMFDYLDAPDLPADFD